LLPGIDKVIAGVRGGDNHASEALDDFRRLDRASGGADTIYMLYGHTHKPEQRAIAVTPKNQDRVYLNTGTWRPVHEMCLDGRGFSGWHELTYTIVYNTREKVSAGKPMRYPGFEVWTGGLKNY